MPKICPEEPEEPSNAGRFHKHVGGLARMRSLLPNAHYGAPLTRPQQSATCIHTVLLLQWLPQKVLYDSIWVGSIGNETL